MLARSNVWWQSLDEHIERKVINCSACVENHRDPKALVLGEWKQTTKLWQRLHVDHAGSFLMSYWLL